MFIFIKVTIFLAVVTSGYLINAPVAAGEGTSLKFIYFDGFTTASSSTSSSLGGSVLSTKNKLTVIIINII